MRQKGRIMLNTLAPKALWTWFDAICAIPHGSFCEQPLRDMIVSWAQAKHLDVHTDDAGNIFIKKDANLDNNGKTIALQAHLDMVTQSDGDFDFSTQPICAKIDGEVVRADGTTLGADNGIGLASILAILDSDEISHPSLVAVFTNTEETGMIGAKNLAKNQIDAQFLINTDAEEINKIYLGCAGGVDANFSKSYKILPLEADDEVFCISLSGLQGGHSGIDIDKNHENAIKLLAHIISGADTPYRLISMNGGTARNAIARRATMLVATSKTHSTTFLAHINKSFEGIGALIKHSEPDLCLNITSQNSSSLAISATDSQKIIHTLTALPNGVLRHSDTVDAVDVSVSLGVLMLDSGHLQLFNLVRALSEDGKNFAVQQLQAFAHLAGLSVKFDNDYIGWQPNIHSSLAGLAKDAYMRQNIKPEFAVIHAGLECGLILEHYPNLDIVSIGPTITDAHSPNEAVHIKSVQTYWNVLLDMLKHADRL